VRREAPWSLAAFVVALLVLHFMLRMGLGLGTLAPDLLVAAVLIAGRQMRAGGAAGLGLLLGVLEGATVPENLGVLALVLALLGFLASRSRELFADDNYLFLAGYLFSGKLLFDGLLLVLSGSAFRPGAFTALFLVSPLAALYVAAAGLACVAAYRILT
jgi:cell shape-determining protein MreD